MTVVPESMGQRLGRGVARAVEIFARCLLVHACLSIPVALGWIVLGSETGDLLILLPYNIVVYDFVLSPIIVGLAMATGHAKKVVSTTARLVAGAAVVWVAYAAYRTDGDLEQLGDPLTVSFVLLGTVIVIFPILLVPTYTDPQPQVV